MANRPPPIRKADFLRPIIWLGIWLYWIGWCVLGIPGAWLYYAAYRVRDFFKGRR
jgi:hypothetical protein